MMIPLTEGSRPSDIDFRLEEMTIGVRKFLASTALRNFRRAKGLSQAQLAEAAGVRQSTIARVEARGIRTAAETAVKIARALGREPGDIFPEMGTLEGRGQLEVNRDVMARSLEIARDWGFADHPALPDIVAALYALLIRERSGLPITDDAPTLSIIGNLLHRVLPRD